MSWSKEENKSFIRREVHGVFYAAAALLLALAFYAPHKWTGPIGGFARTVGLGIVGTSAYIIPAFLIYLSVEFFLENESRMTRVRLICIGLILLTISGMISLWSEVLPESGVVTENVSALQLLGKLWQHGTGLGDGTTPGIWSGGLIGGLIGMGLKAVAGKTGAMVILIAMILALAVLVFNVSYSAYVRKSAQVLKEKQIQVGDSIRSKIQDRKDRQNDIAKYNETKNRVLPAFDWNDKQVSGSDEVDYPDNLRRSTGEEKLELPLTREEIQYRLPEGDLRTSTDDYPDADIDYPMYKGVLSTGAQPQDTAIAVDPTVRDVAEPATTKAGDLSDHKRYADKGAGDTVASDYSRNNWIDRSADTDVPTLRKPEVKGEQLSLFTEYKPFPLSLLKADKYRKPTRENLRHVQEMSRKLEQTLQSFSVEAKVTNYTSGPTLTRFELTPGLGVKVSRIVNLSDDIALNLAAYGVRIEAPIPGKSAIGIEIPNKKTQPVLLRGILEEPSFLKLSQSAPLLSVIGRDVAGQPIYCDISKMPHLLIAGATGSGKSVCINSMLISLLYHSSPQDLRLLLIDPKVVELSVYNGIPHLLQPVVTDPKKAFGVLNWAVVEMDRRYNLFADRQVRDIGSYNEVIKHFPEEDPEYLPLVLIVIDELADLMATTSNEVEDAIQRLMAKARAAGIHVIIATQRPSVDVITGVIKANIPSRIAFSVASQVDSRTILDTGGAEKLLGKGDLLYFPQTSPKALRGQGAFVTDAEVENVLNHIRSLYGDNYDDSVAEAIANPEAVGQSVDQVAGEEEDELFDDALRLVVETGYASISLLQRRLTIGYPRAARLVDRLHDLGYVGPFEGSKPRKVLISMEQYLAMQAGEDTKD